MKEKAFTKYMEQGAYHWTVTYPSKWYKRSPRIIARYRLPLDLLAPNTNFDNSVGLDIGCGDGVMLYGIRQTGAMAVGIEPERSGLLLAKQELAKRNMAEVPLLEGSGYQLPFSDSTFDFVTALELVEHLHSPHTFLKEVVRVLKPNGMVVCTTPNREEGQMPDAVRDPFHVHEYIASEFNDLLKAHFVATSVYGVWPVWLDRIYVNGFGGKLFTKILRFSIKSFSLFYNPYTLYKKNPDSRWQLLIGVGHKAEDSNPA